MSSLPPADPDPTPSLDDVDLETLRDAFIEAFNARDLDAVLDLVADEVEVPDLVGEGREALSEEMQAIWERSPAVILTRAIVDGNPSAVGWLPDQDGSWSRSALVTFDDERGLLTLVEIPDDPDDLARAKAEDPGGEPLDEELDWSE
ncbi:MAG: nuclear transport factor 2 family protein [Egibacteraceae bacterium]